ncbi:hypothetical protein EON83_19845 [bacterium]|nr:MAG: hypothetical protein EON83_19845 [bacterium]
MKLLKITALFGALSIIGGVSFAGAIDGPTSLSDTVQQGKIDVYRINFAGGKKATARAKAAGKIALFVYDSHDALVGKDEGETGTVTFTWTPKETEEFKIKVVNNEKSDVAYKLETN